MILKSFVLVFILCLVNAFVFAVPENGKLRMDPTGAFCLKKGEKKTSTVYWDASILDANNHTWRATGGSISIDPTVNYLGTFESSLGKYEIEFYEPGIYTVTANIIWTYKDLTEERTLTFKIILVDFKEVILDVGPSYAPVGQNVADTSFEIEKRTEDKLKFRAVTTPDTSEVESLINWGTEGGVSTGFTKEINYDSTGTKQISAYIGSCAYNIKVYVNDNASEPIKRMIIVQDKEWAHCGDEKIKLRASAVDHDWKEGVLDENSNNINLSATRWSAALNFGQLNPLIGIETEWKPQANTEPKISNLVVEFKDSVDSYAPRNDKVGTSDKPKIGCFKVKVVCTLQSSGNTLDESSLDEDGNKTGEPYSSVTGSISASSKSSSSNHYEKLTDEKTLAYLVTWEFVTIPEEAVASGKIAAEIATEGRALLEGSVLDGDDPDTPVVVTISPGIGWMFFSLSVEIPLTIGSTDTDEAIAVMSCGFNSDEINFTNQAPSDGNNTVTVASSEQQLAQGTTLTKRVIWQKLLQTASVQKKKNEKIQAKYSFKTYTQAYSDPFKTPTIDTNASAQISRIEVRKNFKNVKYIPSQTLAN